MDTFICYMKTLSDTADEDATPKVLNKKKSILSIISTSSFIFDSVITTIRLSFPLYTLYISDNDILYTCLLRMIGLGGITYIAGKCFIRNYYNNSRIINKLYEQIDGYHNHWCAVVVGIASGYMLNTWIIPDISSSILIGTYIAGTMLL